MLRRLPVTVQVLWVPSLLLFLLHLAPARWHRRGEARHQVLKLGEFHQRGEDLRGQRPAHQQVVWHGREGNTSEYIRKRNVEAKRKDWMSLMEEVGMKH